MDTAASAPVDPPDGAIVADVPPIGVASIPAPADQTRPPAPVPSAPVPPQPIIGSAPDPVAPVAVSELPPGATGPAGTADDESGFPPGVSAKLRSYVYLLVDPRTGRAFYVGRGRDDRCFRHVRAARLGSDRGLDTRGERQSKFPMLDRIREVESGGRAVRIDILRHGLSPDEAQLVEAAAHDALGLQPETKLGSQRRSADEVAVLLAKRAKFKRDHQVVLLRLGSAAVDLTDDRIHHGWRIGRRWTDLGSPRSPRWAVTVAGDLVAAVYRIEQWEPTRARESATGPTGGTDGVGPLDHYSFVGSHDPELEKRYVGRSVAAYTGVGSQNPVTYVWCGPHWVNMPR
jgi:uncharacterized protein